MVTKISLGKSLKYNFNKNGFISLKGIFEKEKCSELHTNIDKTRTLDESIFLSQKEYHELKSTKSKPNPNILDKFDLSFIYQNKTFINKIKSLLGDDFYLYASRIICGVPNSIIPSWINKELDLKTLNLGIFIRPEYRDIRYFHGIDYHMDMIDLPNEYSDILTVYIYLDHVGKEMSPLLLLPGSHYGGTDVYPHNLCEEKNSIKYQPQNNDSITVEPYALEGESSDAWLWHGCLIHGTKVNKSTKPRYSIRLIYRKSANTSHAYIDEVNKKIKNVIALEKMTDISRFDNPNQYSHIRKI